MGEDRQLLGLKRRHGATHQVTSETANALDHAILRIRCGLAHAEVVVIETKLSEGRLAAVPVQDIKHFYLDLTGPIGHAMSEVANAPDIGPLIRETRAQRGMTLDQLAQASGVSKSMLSQIERGQANPTFAVLWGITRALGIDIADLTTGHVETGPTARIDVVRHIGVPQTTSRDGLCNLRILSPPHLAGSVEWYDMTLQPGGALESPPHARGAFEHLTALEGRLDVTSGGDSQSIANGEVARYPADVPHRIANSSGAHARALLVVIYG